MSFWTEKPSSFPLQRFHQNSFHELHKRFIFVREARRSQGRIRPKEIQEASKFDTGRAGFNHIKKKTLTPIRKGHRMLIDVGNINDAQKIIGRYPELLSNQGYLFIFRLCPPSLPPLNGLLRNTDQITKLKLAQVIASPERTQTRRKTTHSITQANNTQISSKIQSHKPKI